MAHLVARMALRLRDQALLNAPSRSTSARDDLVGPPSRPSHSRSTDSSPVTPARPSKWPRLDSRTFTTSIDHLTRGQMRHCGRPCRPTVAIPRASYGDHAAYGHAPAPGAAPAEGTLDSSRSALANRTIIEAFAALAVVRGSLEPSPLEPERLPKHVRYRCATPRRGSCVDRVHSGPRSGSGGLQRSNRRMARRTERLFSSGASKLSVLQ